MELTISNNPARESGAALSEALRAHKGDSVCLLSGGSALAVIEHIVIPKSECRTIFMLGDERVSRGEENNFLQLQKRYVDHPVLLDTIPTVPEVNEDRTQFANRIERTFLQTVSELQKPKIFYILGVGTDGHTAGIFPMDKESFQKNYQEDGTYVPVRVEGLTIDSRASFTPSWILSNVDQLFGFVAGENKKMMLASLQTETKPLHERPAELLKLHTKCTVYTDIQV